MDVHLLCKKEVDRQNLTYPAISKATGLSSPTISRFLCGKSVSPKSRDRLIAFLQPRLTILRSSQSLPAKQSLSILRGLLVSLRKALADRKGDVPVLVSEIFWRINQFLLSKGFIVESSLQRDLAIQFTTHLGPGRFTILTIEPVSGKYLSYSITPFPGKSNLISEEDFEKFLKLLETLK
jgi:transcriptional regulator with XRE-family HTH domain